MIIYIVPTINPPDISQLLIILYIYIYIYLYIYISIYIYIVYSFFLFRLGFGVDHWPDGTLEAYLKLVAYHYFSPQPG